MYLDTERLIKLSEDLRVIEAFGAFFKPNSGYERALYGPIEREIEKFAGFVCVASSCLVVAGLSTKENSDPAVIDAPPSFIGVNPFIEAVDYPNTAHLDSGPVLSLVFETFDHHCSEIVKPQSIAQTFPYAALPLTVPHTVEAVCFKK